MWQCLWSIQPTDHFPDINTHIYLHPKALLLCRDLAGANGRSMPLAEHLFYSEELLLGVLGIHALLRFQGHSKSPCRTIKIHALIHSLGARESAGHTNKLVLWSHHSRIEWSIQLWRSKTFLRFKDGDLNPFSGTDSHVLVSRWFGAMIFSIDEFFGVIFVKASNIRRKFSFREKERIESF